MRERYIRQNNKNPNMIIGTKYINREHFKLVLSQYTVLNEFAIRVLKREPNRMIVSCKDKSSN